MFRLRRENYLYMKAGTHFDNPTDSCNPTASLLYPLSFLNKKPVSSVGRAQK